MWLLNVVLKSTENGDFLVFHQSREGWPKKTMADSICFPVENPDLLRALRKQRRGKLS